jgi:hypothetical protein
MCDNARHVPRTGGGRSNQSEGRSAVPNRTAYMPMEDVRFDRQFRTPYSEGYHLMLGTTRIGSADLHFTSTTVHCTLVLEQPLKREDLAKLIEQIDEDLVLSSDTTRDDFLVSVFQGKEVGFFNDSFRADQEELTLTAGAEFEDEDEGDEDEEDDIYR